MAKKSETGEITKQPRQKKVDNRKVIMLRVEEELYKSFAEVAASEERDIKQQVIYMAKQYIKKSE